MTIDKENMIGVLENFAKQCREALTLPKGIAVSNEITNIFVIGMGGSAIVGDLLKSFLSDTDTPVFVNRNYNMPKSVNENSLVFAVSYSGNTEETLSSCKEALEMGATVIAITSGGKLAELCKKVIKIPSGYQPRAALGYLFFPMLGVLYNSGIINIKNADLNETLNLLKDTESFKEKGQRLSKKIGNKVPIIYSSELFGPVAYRFKTQINENAKCPAFNHVFPEMNHNEINAYQSMDRNKYLVIMIRDEQDHPRIKKRMDVCKSIFEQRVDVEELNTEGASLLARMFSTIYAGDLASYYLAIRNRIDPTPVRVIEDLKKELAK